MFMLRMLSSAALTPAVVGAGGKTADMPESVSHLILHDDIEIAGCPVRKGESLTVSLAAANRDPAVYTDPAFRGMSYCWLQTG